MYVHLAVVGVTAAVVGFVSGAAAMSTYDAQHPPNPAPETTPIDPGMVTRLPGAGPALRTVTGPLKRPACTAIDTARGVPVVAQVSSVSADAVSQFSGGRCTTWPR